MQLYTKTTTPGGRTKYEVYPPETSLSMEVDTEQVVSLLTTVGMCLNMCITKNLPEHSRMARNVKHVDDALLRLSEGNRAPLDEHLVQVGIAAFTAATNEIVKGLSGGLEAKKDIVAGLSQEVAA